MVSDKILVAAFGMNENDVRNIMKHPRVMIGTDGIDVGSKPHPRAWGTYPVSYTHLRAHETREDRGWRVVL